MNMICKVSCSEWFTAGRVYPAAMQNPTFIIAAILADDVCSDLSENGDHWIAPIDNYQSSYFSIVGVASFEPVLNPIKFKLSAKADTIRTAAASSRLFMRKGGRYVPVRMINDKFISDLGREMTISEMFWHNHKGRLAWWG